MASIAYQKGEDVGSAFTESSVLFMSMMIRQQNIFYIELCEDNIQVSQLIELLLASLIMHVRMSEKEQCDGLYKNF